MDEKTRRQLACFFQPESVAVVGASERMGSWGSILMRGLQGRGFPGRIFPVNQKSGEVFGLKAYPSIGAIPDKADLAVLAVPAGSIAEIVEACAEKGIQAITVIAAGFSEAALDGRDREIELAALARRHGIRILGPNVSGTFNLHACFNASPAPSAFIRPTGISGVCQGSYAIYDLLIGSHWRGMSLGQFVQTGNECDLEVTDFLEYFGEDPRTEVIMMYLETLRDVDCFRWTAGRVAKKKPVIVQKVGRTPGGSRAAGSHTGAMAGRHDFFQGLFRQLNLVQSPAMERLIPLAHAFLDLPPMRGRRIGIITMGGSWGVALTDQLEMRGLEVPEFGPGLQGRLRDLNLPIRVSTKNPVDIGADPTSALSPGTVARIAREILASDETDALILHGFGRLALVDDPSRENDTALLQLEKSVMRDCANLRGITDKPILIGSAIQASQSRAIDEFIREGHLVFHHLDEIADVLSLKLGHQKAS
ncbi:MAG: CoA-binding protein [Proteobacteria bacterium]|nr:CoA-binding protein [Pseudomonadota bacterium]